MAHITHTHAGIIQSLVTEFEQHRMPRLFRIYDKVQIEGALTDTDIVFLDNLLHDTQAALTLLSCAPEMREFCFHVVHLHHEITHQALINEGRLH